MSSVYRIDPKLGRQLQGVVCHSLLDEAGLESGAGAEAWLGGQERARHHLLPSQKKRQPASTRPAPLQAGQQYPFHRVLVL